MRRLIYDPNALQIRSIRHSLDEQKDAARYHLQRIVGDELALAVENYREPQPLPSTVYDDTLLPCLSTCGTAVYIWGMARSGKTTVVGSLLALPKVSIDRTRCKSSMLQRAQMLQKAFEPTAATYKAMPAAAVNSQTEVTFATFRHRQGITRRRYDVAFIEARLDDVMPDGLLDAPTEQVHIFCIDPTGNVDVQARAAMKQLNLLERKGVIRSKTLGVYVLVTKVDTFYRVPRDYRSKAAQTMVTIRCRSLWQRIRNICYDKGINSPAPIAYSIGDVKFQALAHLTADYSANLLHSCLVPKCRPERTLLERIMRFGGTPMTTTLTLAFTLAVLYGLYTSFRPDAPAPTESNAVYEFVPDFRQRVDTLTKGKKNVLIAKQYNQLRTDLDNEHAILFRTDDGDKPLVPQAVYDSCRIALDGTIAGLVDAWVEREMLKPQWRSSYLGDWGRCTNSLKNSAYIGHKMQEQMRKHDKHIRTYFDIQKFVKDTSCKTVSAVEAKIRQTRAYSVAPYTNDDATAIALNRVPAAAVSSCATAYYNRADSLRRSWDKERNRPRQWTSWFSSQPTNNQRTLEVSARDLFRDLQRLRELAQTHGASSALSTIDNALERIRPMQ